MDGIDRHHSHAVELVRRLHGSNLGARSRAGAACDEVGCRVSLVLGRADHSRQRWRILRLFSLADSASASSAAAGGRPCQLRSDANGGLWPTMLTEMNRDRHSERQRHLADRCRLRQS